MERALRAHILGRELKPCFVGVDRFVFRAMILKDALHLGNPPNKEQIEQKDKELERACDGVESDIRELQLGADELAKPGREPLRKRDEEADRKQDGKGDRELSFRLTTRLFL